MSSVTRLLLSDVNIICRVTYLQFPIQACFSSRSVSQVAHRCAWFTQYQTSPKIWGGFLYGAYRPEKWLWIDSKGKMETRYLVEESFGSEFSLIYNQCRVMDAWRRKKLKNFSELFALFWKTTTYSKIFKILFWKFSSPHRSTCCVQISWDLVDGTRVKSCIAYLTINK